MSRIFISYAKPDTGFAVRLHRALVDAGEDVWLDLENLTPFEAWIDEARRAIEQSDVFVFVVTRDSVRSKYCLQELDVALAQAKPIVPLVLRETDPADVPPALAALNCVFVREQDRLDEAVDALRSRV